jgi:hypothetical protein
MVVEGVGGKGIGDVVAALATITMTELYPEALDMFRDPLKAMEVALQDADRRLAAIRGVYPELKKGRASFAAVALFNDAYHLAWAGTCRATLVKAGETELLTQDRIESAKNGVVIPSTGLGASDSLIHFAGSYDLGPNAIAITTHSVTKTVRNAAIGQGVERLAAWNAAPAIITLARRDDETVSAAVAVVRAEPLLVKATTSVDAFIEWAESGASTWDSKTLVLQTKASRAPGNPQVSNYAGLPPISGTQAEAEAEEHGLNESTMSFSPEDVRRIVEGARQQGNGGLGTSDSGPLPFARTSAISGDVGAVVAQGARAETERSGTAREATERVGTGAEDDPARIPPKPLSAPEGTMMFSPQQLAEVRASSEQKLGAKDDAPEAGPELERTGDLLAVPQSNRSAAPDESEETRLFSPDNRAQQRLEKQTTPEADDRDTWKGESLSVPLNGFDVRRRATAALICIALVAGAIATYFGFFAT